MEKVKRHPWHVCRMWVAKRLEESTDDWLKTTLRPIVLDLDYEGPPVAGGIYTSLFSSWEELQQIANEDHDGDIKAQLEEDSSMVQDWVLNIHPDGHLEPVAKHILSLFG